MMNNILLLMFYVLKKKSYLFYIFIWYICNNNSKERTWDFIVMFPLNTPHIIIWSHNTLFMKKWCKWNRRIVWKCLGNNGTFHTPNIPTLPLKWRRALKSVKTITINLLHEPTDHKSSILNKYQVELFYRKF